MNAREMIEQEKLENILNPRKTNREFKVTIRFQKQLTRNFENALELARLNPHFMEEGEGDFYKAYASFTPDRVNELYALFELVKGAETTVIFLNNKRIPYIQDLWMFLMWFYRVA
ncbi:MAG: hypothetical protein RB296_08485 [Acidobacteriota bacterium]|jgi:hypothetical protein|nr:hypothetical protein [Acidobacteriota bacterium]